MKEKTIQMKILQIFKYVKNICNENNLEYFAIGGTCIGAIRHKGFIPWDDDLDLAVPIQNYIKLKEILKNDNNNDFKLIDSLNCDSYLFFSKVHDINTTFIEAHEIDYINKYKGVWIDLMPICGIPKNKILQKIMMIKIRYYKAMHDKNHFEFNKKGRSISGKVLWILTFPIRKIHKKNYYSIKYERLLLKYPISDKYDVLFPWRIPLRKPYSNIFDYNFFKSTIELPFEDTSIACPVDYHGYLSKDYGDYMKFPSKEKQVTHYEKGCIIDMENSYKKYQKEKIKAK